MSKPIAIAIVIIAVLIIAFGGYFIFNHFSGSHTSAKSSHDTSDSSVHETHSADTNKNECQDNLNLLQAAVDKYKADKGTYPSKITDLVADYVKEIPKCPGGNGYSIDKNGKVFEDSSINQTPTSQPQTTETPEQKTFTKEELAKYNGKDGNPCYIALNGTVYDLTNMKGWKKGGHGHGILAGKDWTYVFEKFAPKSHKNPEFLKKLPVVGVYVGEKSTEVPKQLKKH